MAQALAYIYLMNSNVCSLCIVDDHTSYRKGLILLLELFPTYEVLFDAANGKDFIAKLNPQKLPNIVLLDISMPEMDGYATAKWIRTNYPTIRILTLSTMDDETSIIRMIQNGAHGYILKDADVDEIERALYYVQSQGFYYNQMAKQVVLQNAHLLANPTSEAHLLNNLTEQEIAFLGLCCTDKNMNEIASAMNKSPKSIEKYRESLCEKFGVTSRVGLVIYAIKKGLVKL